MRSAERWRARVTELIAATMLGSITLSGVALADDISNNLDATIDAEAEVMALNVGGPNGTTSLTVQPRNGDGKPGCNLSSGSLSLSVLSSDTSVATVTPASVTFTSCGDATLTVVPVAAGSTTISVTQVSNSTGGTFNLAPATFTVNVTAPAPSNTAPVLVVSGVNAGATYPKGAVPAATCAVTDLEDGDSVFPAALSSITGPHSVDGLGTQTASCSYTDVGGLIVASSVTYEVVDTSPPAVTYTLDPATPDGDNDWHRGDVTLSWHVSDPESPSTLVRHVCEDQSVSVDQGAVSYSCSATSAGGSAPEQTVTIKRDGTAPVIESVTVNGTPNEHGWYASDVSVTFRATDALSGLDEPTSTVPALGEGVSVLVSSPEFQDRAGNTLEAGAETRTLKIDRSAPNAPTPTLTPLPNAAGWNNRDVVVQFAAAGDNGPSGVAHCSPDVTVTAETVGQTVSGSCTDYAGNISDATQVVVKLDKTDPVIQVVSVDGAEGRAGWYTSDVRVTFSASDSLSGLVGAASPVEVSSVGEGDGVQVASPVFSDQAGNTTGPLVRNFKVDKTGPAAVAFVGGPEADASYYFGGVPSAPECVAEDAVSGLASCVVTGHAVAVGAHQLTATATDNAGNTTRSTRTYTVEAWDLSGFYSPVNMGGVLNTVKAGSTVPLKFEIFAGGELTDVSAIRSFQTAKYTCSTSAFEDAIEITSTGGTSLRYDSSGGQFIQNWQTPKGAAGSCYKVTMTTQDGSAITALFKLK